MTPRSLIPAFRLTGSLLSLTLAAGGIARAQNGGSDELGRLKTAYLADFADLEKKFTALAEAFPADKYGWQPMPGVRSVSQVLALVAAENYSSLTRAFGGTPPADVPSGPGGMEKLEKIAADKAAATRHLKASFALARQTITGWTGNPATPIKFWGEDRDLANLFTTVMADQHEHLGQLIAYARMNRIVPPWSRKSE
jgi:hypothetical protein